MRDRVYGLETEYAIIYQPAVPGGPTPTARSIYGWIEERIRATFPTLPSRTAKGGIFLPNGGLIYFESSATASHAGLLEVSTPECATPFEATVYHVAMERMLVELQSDLNKVLHDAGWDGHLFFAKNGTDNKGHFYGTHENYYVDDVRAAPPFIRALGMVLFTALHKPSLWLIERLFIALFFLGHIVVQSGIFMLNLVGLGRSLNHPHVREARRQTFARLSDRITTWLTNPLVRLYSSFLRRTVLRDFISPMLPFFLTRSVWCGAGRVVLDADGDGFELMQRSAIIGRGAAVTWSGSKRPIVEFRHMVTEPRAIMGQGRRLEVTYSDSNMSEVVTYLKLGVTGLLLEMCEDGASFEKFPFIDVAAAARAFSQDSSMRRKVKLKDGREVTALEVQRAYLQAARQWHEGRPDAEGVRQDILHRWGYVLDCLEAQPELLYRDLDWVAKRDLMHEALKGKASWDELKALHEHLADLASMDLDAMQGMDNMAVSSMLRDRLPAARYAALQKRIEYLEISWSDLIMKARVAFQVQKLDLKFHDLTPRDGYYLRLRGAGMTTRLVPDEALLRGRVEPPARTRAFFRGQLVQNFAKAEGTVASVSWNEFSAGTSGPVVRFTDPLDPNPSGESK